MYMPTAAYVNVYRAELRTANDAAARRQGQQAFSYSPNMEVLDVVEAFTRKADGRVLPVDHASIHDQLPSGTSDRALITDLREKVLVFPEVAGGDTLVYALRRTVRHPLFPGRSSQRLSGGGTPLQDYSLTIRAPRRVCPAHRGARADAHPGSAGRRLVHRWHGTWRGARTNEALGPYDRQPRVFVSSEPDYAAFARDYAALVLPHARVTPRVQALADQ